ncbi:MAG TPA: DUF6600 domain-containing protein [Chthoniobacterales bacterium]
MKRFAVVVVTGAFAFAGCQKQQSEADRNAEVEREVQARLASEHQAAEQQKLAARQAKLDAREKALADKERAPETSAQQHVAEPSSAQPYQAAGGGGESYSVFYTRLEPLGAWLDTPTYGYVWQPRDAMESRSWRPYTNGHWVYTDAGWTWISDEPFGWATYHYGRWTRLRGIGWVWVPGDEWAPAWVSWRVSSDYVGWAPLPPEANFEVRVGIHNWADNYYDLGPEQYCFVPTRDIGSERIERVVVPPEQNVTIVNQTTNVTNITYNNTVVVNQGPNYDELRARSQQPIQRLRLERRTTIAAENLRPVVKGEVVEVSAPLIARAQPVERPPIVKQKVSETVVEQVAEQPAAKAARAKMKAEATPPPDVPPKTFVKPAPVAGQPRPASPASRAATSPVVRSTITPAPTAAMAAAIATATPRRFTRPAHTPPPVGTPALPAAQAGVPQPTPSPELTPTLRSRLTATPAPIGTPALTSPRVTPTPAAFMPPAVGRAAERKQERRMERELRKQERAERKAERFGSPTATPSPLLPGAPGGPAKEHKERKRPGEPETRPTTTPVASP